MTTLSTIPETISRPVLRTVGEVFGVSVEELLGPRRHRRLAWPRQAAIWMLQEAVPRVTCLELAELFGRDHTTVLYSVQAAQERAKAEPGYAALVAEVWQRLGLVRS